jgi:hypothetical protein
MTESAPSWGAPPRQRLRPWHIVLIVLGGIALFGIGLWQFLAWALGPMIASGDDFMAAVRDGDFARAYALSTPELQREVGDAGRMRASAESLMLTEWSWSQRSIRNETGRLIGTASYQGGRSGAVSLQLHQVDGQWRVAAFRFAPPR